MDSHEQTVTSGTTVAPGKTVTHDVCEKKGPSYFGITFTSIIFIMILFSSSKIGDYYTVKNNWGEYRCQTEIMLFASLFGHDTMENLQFCLKSGFDIRASNTITPFYGILSGFASTLMTLLSSINSIRMVFATLVGSISQVFSEFTTRVKTLIYRIQMSAFRIKFLMSRVFGTMYSLIYMGMSGIKSVQNFSNTPIFKFITFMSCFPPETMVPIHNRGPVQMKDVSIGDILYNKYIRVTGTVSIIGDGQQMFRINGVDVSATHYVNENNRWILSKDSKQGKQGKIWNGGVNRPLTCLITSTHTLPLRNTVFSDYHETERGDMLTMKENIQRLNRKGACTHVYKNYITGVHGDTEICLADGSYCPADSIQLGTKVRHGTIVAIIKRECNTFSIYKGETFGYATAVWKEGWQRGDSIDVTTPAICISFAVSPSAVLETRGGTIFRDMFEIHDLDIQTAYADAMKC